MRWQMMLAPAVLVLVAGCGDRGTQKILEPTIVTGLTVTPDIAELLVGEELQLKAQPVDQDGNAVGMVHIDWSTPDTVVARVVGWGIVKAVGPGSARITAKTSLTELPHTP